MIRATASAILTALTLPADTYSDVYVDTYGGSSRLVVYDTRVPDNPTFPYVVLFSGTPDEESDRASGQTSTANHEFQTTVVGISVDQVRLLLEWVRQALLDVALVVTGRLSTQMRPLSSTDPRVDYDVPAKPLYASIVWGFFSVPA